MHDHALLGRHITCAQISHSEFFDLGQTLGEGLKNSGQIKNTKVGTIWTRYLNLQDIIGKITLGLRGVTEPNLVLGGRWSRYFHQIDSLGRKSPSISQQCLGRESHLINYVLESISSKSGNDSRELGIAVQTIKSRSLVETAENIFLLGKFMESAHSARFNGDLD